MVSHITITPISAPVSVSAGGTSLGHSHRALELKEGSYPSVIYVPRDDLDMSRLAKTERATTCPWKGQATYYSIKGANGVLESVVWSYEAPKPGMEAIAGHLAFYTDRVTVTRG